MSKRLPPKQITIRLSSKEAAGLAHCRGHREVFLGRRFTVKEVLLDLLQTAVINHQNKKFGYLMPSDSPLEQIQTGMATTRLSLVITPEIAAMFNILKVRPDGFPLTYGEADILRVLILMDSGKWPL